MYVHNLYDCGTSTYSVYTLNVLLLCKVYFSRYTNKYKLQKVQLVMDHNNIILPPDIYTYNWVRCTQFSSGTCTVRWVEHCHWTQDCLQIHFPCFHFRVCELCSELPCFLLFVCIPTHCTFLPGTTFRVM